MDGVFDHRTRRLATFFFRQHCATFPYSRLRKFRSIYVFQRVLSKNARAEYLTSLKCRQSQKVS